MADLPLQGKKLLLGVTGSIAAYKAAEIVRLFKKAGAETQVVMTAEATRFITPLTLGTLSEREVMSEVFPENETGSWTKHVGLGMWADLYLIAPATAQTMAKLAHGFCDSMLTATALAARCPIVIYPAMDHDMYLHAATQENITTLRRQGYEVVEPEHGSLASGLIGVGRLPEPETIFAHTLARLQQARKLAGRKVLVTAGPTREPIDPVRFISNGATGTMGFALAAEAARQGAQVVLLTGPVSLPTPSQVQRIDVTTADEMYAVALQHADADLIIAAAAVGDYTPAHFSPEKIKKGDDDLTLHLHRTPDVLKALGEMKRREQKIVGFALETNQGEANAWAKLEKKNLDWIALNYANEEGAGFGPGTNRILLLHRDGKKIELARADKATLAAQLLQIVVEADTAGEEGLQEKN